MRRSYPGADTAFQVMVQQYLATGPGVKIANHIKFNLESRNPAGHLHNETDQIEGNFLGTPD
jgi:hypothetical protein